MRSQPLIPIALSLIAGILFSEYYNPAIIYLLFLATAFLLAVFIFLRSAFATTALLCGVTFFAGAALLQAQKSGIEDQALSRVPTYTKITAFGTVASTPIFKNERQNFSFALKAIRIDSAWYPANGKLHISSNQTDSTLQLYQELFANGNLVWPLAERNPGDFNYKRFLQSQGIQATLRVRSDGWVEKTGTIDKPYLPVSKWLEIVHEKVGFGIDTILDPEASAVLRALLLGDRREIDPVITENFARSGVIHILAVSGLHVGFVIILSMIIGWLLRLKERNLILLTLLVIWIYSLITGLKPPVVRASVMASIFMIGRFRDKPVPTGNLLAFAAILLLLFRPGDIFHAGFQLSFAAVAGIIFLYPKFENGIRSLDLIRNLYRFGVFKWSFRLMAVSLAAQIGTLPFSGFHFGRISLIGVFANLVVIPAVFLIVITGAISLIFLPVSSDLAYFAGALPNILILLVIRLTEIIASLPFSSLENWHPPIWVLLLYIIVVVALYNWRKAPARAIAFVATLLILNFAVWQELFSGRPKLKATFLDIGQGDASFIQLPAGQNILIDAGPHSPGNSDFDAGEKIILPFFNRHGVKKLDMVFVTHPHIDHIGGLQAIVEEIQVERVVLADTNYKSDSFQKLLQVIKKKQIQILFAKRGQVFDIFTPVKIWVTGPTPDDRKRNKNLNEASLVLQIRYGKTAMLFTGDTEFQGEQDMLPFGDLLHSDILQVGHHGSRTSSTASFLNFVKPDASVISVGAFNRFKHPNTDVTNRLAALGSDTLRTDLSGGFVFTSDGITFERIK
jgi:competence protein ComEC